AVSELPVDPATPAIGVAVDGDATGVIAPGGDVGEVEVAGHWLGCGMVGRAAVSELPKPSVSPAEGVAKDVDSAGVQAVGGDHCERRRADIETEFGGGSVAAVVDNGDVDDVL